MTLSAAMLRPAIWLLLVACGLPTVWAQTPPPPSPPRSADAGNVTAADFQGAVPDPRPKSASGDPLVAETASGFEAEVKLNVTTLNGAVVGIAIHSITVTTIIDPGSSWSVDPTKMSPELLKHEQGHVDLDRIAAIKAQTQINKQIAACQSNPAACALLPKGTKGMTEAEVMNALTDAAVNLAKSQRGTSQQDYDKATDNGSSKNPAVHQKAYDAQQAALAAPNTQAQAKTGSAEAKSQSDKSISFNASTGRLTVDHDTVIGVTASDPAYLPDPLDAVLGADVLFPQFQLVGQNPDGLFFFSALGPLPALTLSQGGTRLISTDLGRLMYSPLLNMFYGLGSGVQASQGMSRFVDTLMVDMATGAPALFGIELRPHANFMAESAGFSLDAHSGFFDTEGLRRVHLPEPPDLGLVLLGLAGTVVTSRRRRGAVPAPGTLGHHGCHSRSASLLASRFKIPAVVCGLRLAF